MPIPPSGLQFEPLIPLPSRPRRSPQPLNASAKANGQTNSSASATRVNSTSPLSSLFDVPSPQHVPASASTTEIYDPLFFSKSPPRRVGAITTHQPPSVVVAPVTHDHQLSPTAPMTMEPSPPPSSPGEFGDFVEIDPLSQAASFSPLSSPTRSTKLSNSPTTLRTRPGDIKGDDHNDGWNLGGAFDGNGVSAQGSDSHANSNSSSKVMQELERAGNNENDPLGWLSEVPRDPTGNGGGAPFDDWDGMGDELASSVTAAEEIAYHEKAPATPRASRSASPAREFSDFQKGDPWKVDREDSSDDDIIDLKTGRRERYRPPKPTTQQQQRHNHHHHPAPSVNPIAIASSSSSLSRGAAHENSTPSPKAPGLPSTGSSSLFNGFTLPRTWFSSSSASPPLTTQTSSLPRSGLTRQTSVGEFSDLPAPDFRTYHAEHNSPLKKTPSSSRFGIAGVFENPSMLLEGVIPLPQSPNPMAKKVFIPPTGAPGFRPDDNWNPEGFIYDSHSKKDTLGRERLILSGRNSNALPVLSQGVADALRLQLPPLPRLAQSWRLLYSTDQHGISISTLYKNVEKTYGTGGGCVLAVQEILSDPDPAPPEGDDGVWGKPCFGIWIGSGIRCQEGAYYGSGESFLWKTTNSPRRRLKADGVKVFKWTAKNDYVALCESEYISFGGGDGKYGLYVDSSFSDGLSERSVTFENEVLCEEVDANGRGRFECMVLEVWQVGT
ncbi:oxidation resistance protein 1 [Tulasnella sp. JGI-2019a]|nr:oxidation resistance protein 1 [Tulasnella sp. JGI-2019a]